MSLDLRVGCRFGNLPEDFLIGLQAGGAVGDERQPQGMAPIRPPVVFIQGELESGFCGREFAGGGKVRQCPAGRCGSDGDWPEEEIRKARQRNENRRQQLDAQGQPEEPPAGGQQHECQRRPPDGGDEVERIREGVVTPKPVPLKKFGTNYRSPCDGHAHRKGRPKAKLRGP